jgi:outer membrane lipase/esterase
MRQRSTILRNFRRVALAAAVFMLVSPAPELSATHSLRLVFFGDSLSDSGNHFIAFRDISTRPFELVPDAPYAVGGLHFSNGPTWAEQLSFMLRTPASGLPSLLGSNAFTNYAVGRARARAQAPVFPHFDLATQVARYRGDFPAGAPANAVHILWIGSNDLSDALTASASDPSGATSIAIIKAALGSVAAGIQGLWQGGARDFLIVNLPDLALTPAVRAAGPQAQAAATLFTNAFNGGLVQVMNAAGALPGIRLHGLDANGVLTSIVDDPAAAGLTNVEDACLAFGVVQHPFCRTPNDYLFWDGIHPTKAGHTLLAQAAAAVVTVP